jgi:hypothetical protein
MSDEKPFPIHGSVLPKESDPLVALINVDRPAEMKRGSIGFAIANSDDSTVVGIGRFDVVMSAGKFTSVSKEVAKDLPPKQGLFDVAFGEFREEELEATNLKVPTKDIMVVKFFFDIGAASNTFVSPNGRAMMKEITVEFAVKIAAANHVRVPITIRNPKQFPLKDIPLPRPGEFKLLALTSSRFSVVAGKLVAQHQPQSSHVSGQFITGGDEAAIAELDKHEQRHSDITSLTCALGNVFIDAAVAAKTDADRAQARNVAARKVFPSIQSVVSALNRQYDAETNHGEIKTAQKDWDKNLADKLLAAWQSQGGPAFTVEPRKKK